MADGLASQIESLRQYLPPELMVVIEKDGIHIDPAQVLSQILSYKNPWAAVGCSEFITGTPMGDTLAELQWAVKLCAMACCMPSQLPQIASYLTLAVDQFNNYMSSLVAQSAQMAYDFMNEALEQKQTNVTMTRDAQVAGFFLRTPVRCYNKDRKPILDIPSWNDRDKLLHYFVIGPISCYVLRQNTSADQFECYVLFRGTTTEFSAVGEYGWNGKGTQVFCAPNYDLANETAYPEGSATVPLVSFMYATALADIRPHIFQCLERLGSSDDKCKRVLFVGHSMGAALAQLMAYQMAQEQHPLWKKSFFRCFATPLCCNDAAVSRFEHWVIESGQKYKYMEVVNTDDVVNVQYKFGGAEGFQAALTAGSEAVAAWLLSHLPWSIVKDEMISRIVRSLQMYPELAAAVFVQGFMRSQVSTVSRDPAGAFRPGMRMAELVYARLPQLKKTYNQTMAIWFCNRRVDFKSEYLGKCHSHYLNINMSIFWSSCREYENKLYRHYHETTLATHPSQLVLVGCFNERDLLHVKPWMDQYRQQPLPELRAMFDAWKIFLVKPITAGVPAI